MTKTLYFYDLETTGFNPKEARIMQFAGQRTDLSLKKLGDPHNILIKLTNDIIPDPGAILVTGITPQQTIADGITEAEFLEVFHKEISIADTIFVGFNSVRFDDEFMRYLNYRNFYDPYEWQWKDGRAKWDLLDVVRMTRALRPDGINWPSEGNRLELLTKANNIVHEGAHDALSDVNALIDLAVLIKQKQPKLFDYLLNTMSSKNNVTKLVNENEAFVYTSGKYPSDFEKTTVVANLIDHPTRGGVLVFDLRFDPNDYAKLSVEELAKYWRPEDKLAPRLPIKSLQFNRCPAIAPLSVLDKASEERIGLKKEVARKNYLELQKIKPDFSKKVLEALEILDKAQDKKYAQNKSGVDGQLYDKFFTNPDKNLLGQVRRLDPADLDSDHLKFEDMRLNSLLPLYKARNFQRLLSPEETGAWNKYRKLTLLSGDSNSRLGNYFKNIEELLKQPNLSSNQRYLLDELTLYGESIAPIEDL